MSFGKSDVSVLPTNSLESELDSKELSSSFNSLLLAAAHLIGFVWCPFIFLAFAKDISNFRYFSMNYFWIILNLNTSPGWWNLGPIGIRNNKSRGFLVSNMYNLSTSKVIYAVLRQKFLRFQFFLVAWGWPDQLAPGPVLWSRHPLQQTYCRTLFVTLSKRHGTEIVRFKSTEEFVLSKIKELAVDLTEDKVALVFQT